MVDKKERVAKAREFFLKGYQSTILIPKNKDWNEDLLFMRKEGKCQEH